MDKQHLISAIEAHAKAKGIAPATVTSRAVQNSRLYHHITGGGDCTFDTAARVLAFIEADAAQGGEGAK